MYLISACVFAFYTARVRCLHRFLTHAVSPGTVLRSQFLYTLPTPPHHLSHTCEIFSAEVTHVQCRIFVTSISHQTDPHKFSRSSATSSCFLLFMVIDCCFLVSQVTIATFADTCPKKTLCNPKNSLLLARSLCSLASVAFPWKREVTLSTRRPHRSRSHH